MKVSDLFEAPRSATASLIKKIERECGDMLRAYQKAGGVLYRGIKGVGTIANLPIRKDRKPVEMPPASHELLAKAFTELGLKTNRMNSIFCTPMSTTADDWGDRYIIFVKDGWTALVFDDMQDDYSFYNLKNVAQTEDIIQVKKVIKDLKPREFTSAEDLAHVIDKSYYEVLITGDAYVAVHHNFWRDQDMETKLGIGK